MTYYIAREPSQARRIASSLAWVGTAQLAAVFVVQAAALAAVAHSEPQRVQLAAAISLLLPPGILALSFGLAILQGQRRFTAYNTLRVAPSVAYVVGVVVVYVSNATSLVLFMALWAAVNLVGGLIALVFSVRGLPKHAAEDETPSRWQMLRFGFKAFLGSLSPVDVVRLDQAVVGLFLAPVTLGFYVVAQALANLPRVVATSIGFVAYPQVAAERDRASARRAMWRFFFLGLGLSALVVGFLELMAGQLITLFFGEDFTEATAITEILLLASLFMAGRRVLTDGINGIGHPGFGTIAEITSWILLIPGLAILLPWLGAEGVALALAISWGASLLLLIVLALAADRTPALGRGRLAGTIRRLAVVPRRLEAREWLGLAGALIVAVLAGLAVVLSPTVGIGLAIVLALGLLFAFGRKTFAEHARAFRRRVARPDVSVPDDAIDEEFAVPRRLYYGGVLMLGLLTLRVGGQVTFSDLLFLASFLFACAEFVILRRRVPMKLPFLLLIGVALFSLGGLLSTFESYQTLKSIAVVARLVFLTVFWFWLGTIVLRRRAHVTRAIGFWVVSAAICGSGAILQFLAGDIIPNTSFEGGRATGFTPHPNDLGGLTAIAFVPALMLASRPRTGVVTRAWSYRAAPPRRGRPDSVRVDRRSGRGCGGGRRLAGVPADNGSHPARPGHSRCVCGRRDCVPVGPWSARPTRPTQVGDELHVAARRQYEARIRRPADRHVPGSHREDQGRPIRGRGARSEQRDSTVRGRGVRIRHSQSRDRPLVQDRAPGARRNSDRVACAWAIRMDCDSPVELGRRIDGSRRTL